MNWDLSNKAKLEKQRIADHEQSQLAEQRRQDQQAFECGDAAKISCIAGN